MKADALKLALAEALLRCVTGAEHAAAIAGDLLEAAATQRRAFGRDVASAVACLATQSLTVSPLRTLQLLGSSAVVWTLTYVAVRLVLAVPGWLSVADPLGNCLAIGGLRAALLAAALILSGLLSGALLGALAHRGAVSPALPLAAAFLAAGPVLTAADLMSGHAVSWHCLMTYLLLMPLCYALPLLCGAALGRSCRESLRSSA